MVRRGRRSGRSRLVVHVLLPGSGGAGAAAPRADVSGPGEATPRRTSGGHRTDDEASPIETAPTRERGEPTRVGFVVSKAVGNAVVRHRVARRLRHLMRDRLAGLPPGTLVVVRALPPAARANSRELGKDLDAAFRKLQLPTSAAGSH
ncbi:ribonuclease P protein component [Halopolyspora algeriensis]|uniref:Ribonuclease P protein component n=1 Tax=Halopolyspora algeriensis TaxID=1500506 RepID=A0A368W0S4_9ACTN|nr:ribonuclease P protein component [Halopolyspora algeriensis]TQM48317.1 ribonuclease P protein component [Halopolyspora algeriensis]